MTAYIFDTETTSVATPELIEAGWLAMSEDLSQIEPRKTFLQRYRPSGPISFGAMAVHHILPSDLADCPATTEFRVPADMTYMIGHNVDFDWEVAGKPDVKRICTLAMAREVWPDADSYTVAALSYLTAHDLAAMRLELRNAHNALADCRLCARILFDMIKCCGDELHSWEDVYQFSERARLPKRMPFGKHSGIPIADVPHDYREWLLRQSDVDPYLRRALEAAGQPPSQKAEIHSA